MFSLTHQERKVLIFIGSLILIGSILKFFNIQLINKSTGTIEAKKTVNYKIPININKASSEELEAIPGVGEVTAQSIIQYRADYGSFQDLEDLKKIRGIGDKKAEIINKYIVFK
jgi:comEA protein